MDNKPKISPVRAAAIASLAGLWAITPSGAAKVRQIMAAPNWDEPMSDPRYDQRATRIEGGLAIIPVIGVITKYAFFWDRLTDFVSASWIESEIDKAEAAADVKSIVLLIDSPGGMVDGSTQLASRIARCKKPVIAVGSDCCCSAAYYLASQCKSVSMNETGSVGSIGIVCTGMDDSEYWASLGIHFEVVASGGVKGEGHNHKITDALKAEWQRGVDDNYQSFLAAISRGRDLAIDDVRRLADGRTFRAAEAASLKLIDRVADASTAIDAIKKEVVTMTQQEFMQTAASNPEWLKSAAAPLVQQATADAKPKAATIAELKAAFPGDANSTFVLDQFEKGASLDAAKAARGTVLEQELSATKARLAQLDPSTAGTQALNVTDDSQKGGKRDEPKASLLETMMAARFGGQSKP